MQCDHTPPTTENNDAMSQSDSSSRRSRMCLYGGCLRRHEKDTGQRNRATPSRPKAPACCPGPSDGFHYLRSAGADYARLLLLSGSPARPCLLGLPTPCMRGRMTRFEMTDEGQSVQIACKSPHFSSLDCDCARGRTKQQDMDMYVETRTRQGGRPGRRQIL